MSDRHIVVVDCETNGLNPDRHQAVEVAWWNLTTDASGCFIPSHNVSDVLAGADIQALRINRYIDRIAGEKQDGDNEHLTRLYETLAGNILAGSNPSFDALFLNKCFQTVEWLDADPWHHRKLDLAAYAAGVLGLPAAELPGLAKVAELLELDAKPDHSAEADVTATGVCFRALFRKAGLA